MVHISFYKHYWLISNLKVKNAQWLLDWSRSQWTCYWPGNDRWNNWSTITGPNTWLPSRSWLLRLFLRLETKTKACHSHGPTHILTHIASHLFIFAYKLRGTMKPLNLNYKSCLLYIVQSSSEHRPYIYVKQEMKNGHGAGWLSFICMHTA